jgi:hypothetical protein
MGRDGDNLDRMRSRRGRKLLVASLGVAAVSYVACGGSSSDDKDTRDASTDAAGDAAADATMDVLVANLIAPPVDASDATFVDVVANLVPPPPPPEPSD